MYQTEYIKMAFIKNVKTLFLSLNEKALRISKSKRRIIPLPFLFKIKQQFIIEIWEPSGK